MVKSNAGYLAEATRDAITILHWQQASQKLAAELRARVKLHPAVTIQEQHLILKRFSVEVDADLLIAYVSKHYPNTKSNAVMKYVAWALAFIKHSPIPVVRCWW